MKYNLFKLLLLKMNKLKSQISIIKEPKIVNSWDQKDTQSPINHDDRCIISFNVKNVE